MNFSSSDDQKVKVCVRVRPLNQKEKKENSAICVSVDNNAQDLLLKGGNNQVSNFAFDFAANPHTPQEEMFFEVGKSVVESCVRGYNGTIFAYGQTGSGKTWTMQGNEVSLEDRGLIPRVIDYLFGLVTEQSQISSGKIKFSVRCSYLEIYNEQILDLLNPTNNNLQIRESLRDGIYVENLIQENVSDARSSLLIFKKGAKNRRASATEMNPESSRSHSVFTVYIQCTDETKNGTTLVRSSRLNLIDLAGSERQTQTKTSGIHLKEAGNINKSLSTLSNVIRALVDKEEGHSRYIHYRDSKLTFLLKDSLGGNSKTTIVTTISPADKCFGETLSTLKFAQRAKQIRNTAKVNEDTTKSVQQLEKEIQMLKGQINQKTEIPKQIPSLSGEDIEKMKKLSTQVEGLTDELHKREKYIQSTHMILKLREAKINALEKRIPVPKDQEIVNLRKEIELLNGQVENHPDLRKVLSENKELKQEISSLKRKVKETSSDAKPKMTFEYLSRFSKNGDISDRDLKELVNQINERVEIEIRQESELKAAKEMIEQYEMALNAMKLHKQIQIQTLTDQYQEDVGENSVKQKELEIKNSELSQDKKSLLETIANQQEEIIKLKGQLLKVECSNSRATQISQDPNHYSNRISVLSGINERLTSHSNRNSFIEVTGDFFGGQKQKEEIEVQKIEVQRLKEELQQSVYEKELELQKVKEETETLTEEFNYKLDSLQKKFDTALEENEKLQNEKSKITKDNLTLQEKLQLFHNTNQTSSKEIQKLSEDLSTHIETIQKLSSELEESHKLNKKLTKEIEDQNENLKELEEEIEKLRNISNDLRENLNQTNSSNLQFRSELESLKNETRELNEQLNESNLFIKNLQKEKENEQNELIEQHQKEIENQQELLEETKKNGQEIYQQVIEEYEQLKVNFEEVKNIFQQSEQEYEDTMEKMTKEHQTSITQMQQEFEELLEKETQKFTKEKLTLEEKLYQAQTTFDQYSKSLITDLNRSLQKEKELTQDLEEKINSIEKLEENFTQKVKNEIASTQLKLDQQTKELKLKSEQLTQTMNLVERMEKEKESVTQAIQKIHSKYLSTNQSSQIEITDSSSKINEQLNFFENENEKLMNSNQIFIQQLQKKELENRHLKEKLQKFKSNSSSNSENFVNQVKSKKIVSSNKENSTKQPLKPISK